MPIRVDNALLVMILIIFSFIFQTQLKIFVNETGAVFSGVQGAFSERIYGTFREIVFWRLVLIGALAVALFTIWILMLLRMELSVALPLASLTIVTNAIGGGLLLGEAISPLRMIGILTVSVGIAIVVKS